MAMLSKFSSFCAVLFAGVGAVLLSVPASAQDTHQILDGFWNALYDEDQPERIPGPDQGDYAGLPITAAAASVAQTWDPEVLTIPYLQCRPHPALYGIRGVGQLRIWEQLDQQTLQQVAIHTWIVAGSRHPTTGWMAARIRHRGRRTAGRASRPVVGSGTISTCTPTCSSAAGRVAMDCRRVIARLSMNACSATATFSPT